MKKTNYGNTEIWTENACMSCSHLIEDEETGKKYCELDHDFEVESENDAPHKVLSVYHGTYGNVWSNGCDCEEYEMPYDGE